MMCAVRDIDMARCCEGTVVVVERKRKEFGQDCLSKLVNSEAFDGRLDAVQSVRSESRDVTRHARGVTVDKFETRRRPDLLILDPTSDLVVTVAAGEIHSSSCIYLSKKSITLQVSTSSVFKHGRLPSITPDLPAYQLVVIRERLAVLISYRLPVLHIMHTSLILSTNMRTRGLPVQANWRCLALLVCRIAAQMPWSAAVHIRPSDDHRSHLQI